jgi:hypothetical protein
MGCMTTEVARFPVTAKRPTDCSRADAVVVALKNDGSVRRVIQCEARQ